MGTGYCGVVPSEFSVTSSPVLRNGQAEEIYFGVAPEGATKVLIEAGDGKVFQARTQEAVPEFAGDVWAIAVPGPLSDATANWVGASGKRGGADRRVTSLLASSKL